MTSSNNHTSTDELYAILADSHRRLLLKYLSRNENSSCTLQEAVQYISDRHDAIKAHVEVALHHNHIPRLEEADFIEYDRKNRVIHPKSEERLAQAADRL